MTTIKLKKHLKNIIVVSILIIGVNTLLNNGQASAAMIDLKQYYPNPALYKNYYLEGFNYETTSGTPERSVLWFEDAGSQGGFKIYNTAPEEPAKRCGWDALKWTEDSLYYSQTHDGCGGHNKDVIYNSQGGEGIKFLPRYWDDSTSQDWVYESSVPVKTTTLDGSEGCDGINTYKSTVTAGYTDIDSGVPVVPAIHWVTEQNTVWTKGDDQPWCIKDGVTPWREDYYMLIDLPIEGYTGLTTANGLKRTVGGNFGHFQDTNHHDWDIWFATWKKLPWGIDPGTTGTPNDPGGNGNNNGGNGGTPGSPKTGQIGAAVVALAVLGGLLFVSALAVKKTYRKKKGLPPTKAKVGKPPKPGKPPKAPKPPKK